MSFLVGTISGALVASGCYYALFSHDLQTRTFRHRKDLHSLVINHQGPQFPAPPPAASRIQKEPPIKQLFKQRWNEGIEELFVATRNFNAKVVEWGRRLAGDGSPR